MNEEFTLVVLVVEAMTSIKNDLALKIEMKVYVCKVTKMIAKQSLYVGVGTYCQHYP
ncbi:MAG: hypothetical protein N4A76_11680 [Firmicutes bacterium]|nr:hypothetical protein [Bacillota bacterium]